MTNRSVKGREGALTYQLGIVANNEIDELELKFADFKPYVRGNELAAEQAPNLEPEEITDFAIEIRRSSQPPKLQKKNPLDFALQLLMVEKSD